jgi:hypothetical protein
MINAPIGMTKDKMPSDATLANARCTGTSTVRATSPKNTAPTQGTNTPNHRFGGTQERKV